jgi:hypothetical protein
MGQSDGQTEILYIEVMAKSMETGATCASYSTIAPRLYLYPVKMREVYKGNVKDVEVRIFDFYPFFDASHYKWLASRMYTAWVKGETFGETLWNL